MIPTRRLLWLSLLLVAASGLPILFSPGLWQVPVAVFALLVTLAALDAIWLLRLGLGVEVSLPSVVGVGGVLLARARLRARQPNRVRVLLRLEIDGEGAEAPAERALVLAGGAGEIALPVLPKRRGKLAVPAVWLRARGRLGVLERVRRVPLALGNVTVVPNVALVRDLALAELGKEALGGRRQTLAFTLDRGAFDTLVAYEPGMDLRTIDWKASARHQAPRARRYRPEQNQRLVFCLDTGRLMGDPVDGLQRLDHGVHAALLVAYAALRAGDLVGLHAYDEGPVSWLPPASGTRHMTRLRHAASELAAREIETNHFLGLRDLFARLRRRSLVVCFSEFDDWTTAELMMENVGQIAQRHVVVFVALDDPLLEAPRSVEPTTREELARAVVTASLRRDRRRVLRRLRQAGVEVVTGPPGPAAIGLLKKYLEIKRHGVIG